MSKLKKFIYITLGLIAVLIGIIGIAIPMLPTTPFLLVASYFFAKGSERYHNWFTNTKLYKNHIKKFSENKAMTLRNKLLFLFSLVVMITTFIIIVENIYLRLFFICLVAFKAYYVTFKVKTKKVT